MLPEYPNYAEFVKSLNDRDNFLLLVSIFAAAVPLALVICRYSLPRRIVVWISIAAVVLTYASIVFAVLEYYQ
jgi:hypothetical protein